MGATAAVGVEVAAPVPNPKLGAAEVFAGGAPREKPPVPPAGAVLAPNENVISVLESLLLFNLKVKSDSNTDKTTTSSFREENVALPR